MQLIQIFLSLTLITLIIMQSRGTGLGSAWGGSGQSYHSKRGVEKAIFYLTILTAFAFVVVSIINIL